VATSMCNQSSIFYQSRLLEDTGRFLDDKILNFYRVVYPGSKG
jgi:hypothetical protein